MPDFIRTIFELNSKEKIPVIREFISAAEQDNFNKNLGLFVSTLAQMTGFVTDIQKKIATTAAGHNTIVDYFIETNTNIMEEVVSLSIKIPLLWNELNRLIPQRMDLMSQLAITWNEDHKGTAVDYKHRLMNLDILIRKHFADLNLAFGTLQDHLNNVLTAKKSTRIPEKH